MTVSILLVLTSDGSMIRNGAESIPVALGLLASSPPAFECDQEIRWPSDALEAQLVRKSSNFYGVSIRHQLAAEESNKTRPL